MAAMWDIHKMTTGLSFQKARHLQGDVKLRLLEIHVISDSPFNPVDMTDFGQPRGTLGRAQWFSVHAQGRTVNKTNKRPVAAHQGSSM
jgi:hypothetical protein